MARIDNPDLYNPFGWRLAGLNSLALSGERRESLLEEMLVWEAEELAHGCRHVTVVHGDPGELESIRALAVFYAELERIAGECEWVRVRGDFEHVTVTVRGSGADLRVAEFTAAAAAANPGGWTIVEAAFPPVTKLWP